MLARTLAEAGLGYGDLERLAVTVGPGSFTGLRIGLALARGLALAADLPLLGITTFAACAAPVAAANPGGWPILVAMESRRAELFLQRFSPAGNAEGEPVAREPAAVMAWLQAAGWEAARGLHLGGDGAERLLPYMPAVVSHHPDPAARRADAAVVARLAAALPLPDPAAPLPAPLYLRPPDVTLAAAASTPPASTTGAAPAAPGS